MGEDGSSLLSALKASCSAGLVRRQHTRVDYRTPVRATSKRLDSAALNLMSTAHTTPRAREWQVSPGGGCNPRWRRDGKEIFYYLADNKVMGADLRTVGSKFEVGAVHTLFETRSYGIFGRYDVTADGQRFIVPYEAGQPTETITLVVNWDAELKKKEISEAPATGPDIAVAIPAHNARTRNFRRPVIMTCSVSLVSSCLTVASADPPRDFARRNCWASIRTHATPSA
jgi:hypothetical protein